MGLGFKDHSLPRNSLDALKDGKAELVPQKVYGAYMPDGIAAFGAGGKQYILTANEGDAREWGAADNAYADVASFKIGDYKIDILDNAKKEGLETGKKYLFGARSFSVWETGNGLRQIFDSGNDFGPEPEYVGVLRAGGTPYALIGLERIGGVMVYDMSNPAAPVWFDYINTRDFSHSDLASMGDLGPEGICAVEAKDSPTGRPLIFTANEVSGTIAVFEMRQ